MFVTDNINDYFINQYSPDINPSTIFDYRLNCFSLSIIQNYFSKYF